VRPYLAGIAALAALAEAAGYSQRSMLIQLKQQRASPPIWCAKNSLEHSFGRSTDPTRLSLLGAVQFHGMLGEIGEPAHMPNGSQAE
jgi:hypothetical protein